MPHFTWCRSGLNVTSSHSRWVSGAPHQRCNVSVSSRRWYALDTTKSRPDVSGLPQQLDLLERYRGLVVLGRLSYAEEQIRVIFQVRLPYLMESDSCREMIDEAQEAAEKSGRICSSCISFALPAP